MEGVQQFQIVPECLRQVYDIGETTVMNICNGSSSVVPWGTIDWAGYILATALVLGLIGFLIKIIRD